ncbi:MAG TPA: CYTH domain-containing protein [Anaerolineales bacterium]|nr:CYTH domain-containing protein [Anaerolineales bacterium]
MLEIESKFVVPNPDIFARLLALTVIGDYSLKEPATLTLIDHYLDTADSAILRGGFACRMRHNHSQNTWMGAIKSLGGAAGAVHQRQEYEAAIAPHALPDRWPAGPARDLALQLSAGQPVAELFAIQQERHTRRVVRVANRPDLSGGRFAPNIFQVLRAHLTGLKKRSLTVGELSLDQVEFSVGSQRIQALELEIELAEDGTLDDVGAINRELAAHNLSPQPQSKFERALALSRHQQSFK